jgi:hypothetical protein
LPARIGRAVVEQTDPVDLPRLLGLGGERRGDENGPGARQERAPVYHWLLDGKIGNVTPVVSYKVRAPSVR